MTHARTMYVVICGRSSARSAAYKSFLRASNQGQVLSPTAMRAVKGSFCSQTRFDVFGMYVMAQLLTSRGVLLVLRTFARVHAQCP